MSRVRREPTREELLVVYALALDVLRWRRKVRDIEERPWAYPETAILGVAGAWRPRVYTLTEQVERIELASQGWGEAARTEPVVEKAWEAELRSTSKPKRSYRFKG